MIHYLRLLFELDIYRVLNQLLNLFFNYFKISSLLYYVLFYFLRFLGGSRFANGSSSSLLSLSSNSFGFLLTFGVSREPNSGVSNVAGVNIAKILKIRVRI